MRSIFAGYHSPTEIRLGLHRQRILMHQLCTYSFVSFYFKIPYSCGDPLQGRTDIRRRRRYQFICCISLFLYIFRMRFSLSMTVIPPQLRLSRESQEGLAPTATSQMINRWVVDDVDSKCSFENFPEATRVYPLRRKRYKNRHQWC